MGIDFFIHNEYRSQSVRYLVHIFYISLFKAGMDNTDFVITPP